MEELAIATEINNMALQNLTQEIKRTMRRSAKDAVQLGYMLRRVMEEKLYLEAYLDFDTYLRNELQMDYTMANRFIGINKKYSVMGKSMEIAARYENYGQGLLIEMLNMTPEQEAKVTPDTTVKQAREIKRQDRPQKPAPEPMVPAADMPEKKEVIIDGEFREIKEPEIIATSQPEENGVVHDEAWFIEQYVRILPGEAEELIEVCKKEKSDSSRAKAIQKCIAPYGCHCTSCLEYEFRFNDFAAGAHFRIGSEKMHLKYGRLAKELMSISGEGLVATSQSEEDAFPCDGCGYDDAGCCGYPGTKDDYCVLGDKRIPNDPESAEEEYAEYAEYYKSLRFVRRILQEQQKLLHDYLDVGGLPEETVERQKIITGALAAMVCDLESAEKEQEKEQEQEAQEAQQPELPILRNDEQRRYWLSKYKDWGLWYRDEHIDVNYYKYDFSDGSRLVVAEYPLRISQWTGRRCTKYYYHFLEKQKQGDGIVYDEQYRNSTDGETYLVDFLKKLQKGGGNHEKDM